MVAALDAFDFACHRCGAPASGYYTELVNWSDEFALCAECAVRFAPAEVFGTSCTSWKA